MFRLDTTGRRDGFDAFQRNWGAQVGADFPLPTFTRETTGDFRVRVRASRVVDVAVTDMRLESGLRTEGTLRGREEVRMYVVRRGAWSLAPPGKGSEITVPPGEFFLWHAVRPSHVVVVPHTTASAVVLPSELLGALVGTGQIAGPADSAEMRVLMAHAGMVHETVGDLTPAGVQAAHHAMVELATAVIRRRVDGAEPRLAAALARAAKDFADDHLADPELSPAVVARQLNVSVRTLHRAFAADEESVTSYIRRRRLERARLALTAPSGRPAISELAARWQFADSSHFIRAFKREYGQTPAEYARSNRR